MPAAGAGARSVGAKCMKQCAEIIRPVPLVTAASRRDKTGPIRSEGVGRLKGGERPAAGNFSPENVIRTICDSGHPESGKRSRQDKMSTPQLKGASDRWRAVLHAVLLLDKKFTELRRGRTRKIRVALTANFDGSDG